MKLTIGSFNNTGGQQKDPKPWQSNLTFDLHLTFTLPPSQWTVVTIVTGDCTLQKAIFDPVPPGRSQILDPCVWPVDVCDPDLRLTWQWPWGQPSRVSAYRDGWGSGGSPVGGGGGDESRGGGHRENRENDQKYSLSGKTQGIWKFCQNTGKTQGIWFGQVVNSLILKVKDICCENFHIFFPSFVYVIVTHYVNWHRENLRLDKENTGNLKMQFEWVPCVCLFEGSYRLPTFRPRFAELSDPQFSLTPIFGDCRPNAL